MPIEPTDAPRADEDLATLTATVQALERPDGRLLTYYALTSLVLGPLFPILLIPRYFRYHSTRYRFDDEGVSMRWGILFRREINLTYARIQDIHLRSGVIERHLGLARIEVQTASGSAKAEMTIEGVLQFEAVRDYLYTRMRGGGRRRATQPGGDPGRPDAVAEALREVATELRALRADLARSAGGPGARGGSGAHPTRPGPDGDAP